MLLDSIKMNDIKEDSRFKSYIGESELEVGQCYFNIHDDNDLINFSP